MIDPGVGIGTVAKFCVLKLEQQISIAERLGMVVDLSKGQTEFIIKALDSAIDKRLGKELRDEVNALIPLNESKNE